MKLQIQKGSILRNAPVMVEDITYVVVYDNHGQPIAIVEQLDSMLINVMTAKDEKFQSRLARLTPTPVPPVTTVSGGRP